MSGDALSFPNLGLYFEHFNKSILAMGRVEIRFYGLILGAAILVGFIVSSIRAKKSGQDLELYLDLAVYLMIFGMIGARLYYMFFRWQDQFRSMVPTMLDMKEGGGLCLYGAIISGIITVLIYCAIKRKKPFKILDTLVFGLCAAIPVGRLSDLVERTNFGGYTDNLFAMRIAASEVLPEAITTEMTDAALLNEYRGFIQVRPLFLYDIAFCCLFLLIVLLFFKKQKKSGNIFFAFMITYFAFRIYLDSQVLEPLVLLESSIPVNLAVSIALVVVNTLGMLLYNFTNLSPKTKKKIKKKIKKIRENKMMIPKRSL